MPEKFHLNIFLGSEKFHTYLRVFHCTRLYHSSREFEKRIESVIESITDL